VLLRSSNANLRHQALDRPAPDSTPFIVPPPPNTARPSRTKQNAPATGPQVTPPFLAEVDPPRRTSVSLADGPRQRLLRLRHGDQMRELGIRQ
jgi:hypothetical protein